MRIRAAVAFVTRTGVAALWDIIGPRKGITIEVVARAADATEPEALTQLRERGAEVKVAIARAAPGFHPKLWLLDDPMRGRLSVLSGSGNLTAGGLSRNVEQFEFWELDRNSVAAAEQHERFDHLTASAVAIERVEGGVRWQEWLELLKQQKQAKRAFEGRERRLSEREPVPGTEAALIELAHDLWQLYHGIVEAGLTGEGGGPYRPNRFLQTLRRIDDGTADAVTTATNLCRRQSTGFDVLLVNDQPQLTVEALVVDDSKSYHHLFSSETKALATARLAQFPRGDDEEETGSMISPVHEAAEDGDPDAQDLSVDTVDPAMQGGVGGAEARVELPHSQVIADLERQYPAEVAERLARLWTFALDHDAEQHLRSRAVMLWLGHETSRPLRLGIYVDAEQHGGVGSQVGLEFRLVHSRWHASQLDAFMAELQSIPGMSAAVAEHRAKGHRGWLSCKAAVASDAALEQFTGLLIKTVSA